MQQLLTGKRRFEEFKKLEWRKRKIKESGMIVPGGTPDTERKDFWNGDISWCTPTEITALKGRYLETTKRMITQSGLRNSSAELLPVGSVIVCTRATIGDCAINTVPMTTNQGFKSIVPFEDVSSEFLYHWITFNKHKLLRVGAGSTFAEISKRDFENLVIDFPQLPEQQRIASVLSAHEDEINSMQRLNTLSRKQKKALMRQLLTGKIRVKTDPQSREQDYEQLSLLP